MTEIIRPDFPMLWDNTMRSAFATCRKKFFWEFLRNLGSSDTSVHPHFGAVFASGLETLRMEFYGKNGCRDQQAAKLKAAEKIISEWGDYEAPEGQNKNLATCLGALEAYCLEYPLEDDVLQPHYDVKGNPSVEFSFSVPIEEVLHPVTGEPLIYCGRFDMLSIYNGQLFIEDDKTTKQLGASWLKQWDMRSQITGYCWGAKKFSLPVAGAVIRGISILKTKFGHAQVLTYRSEEHIAMWYEQLIRDMKSAIACWESGYWDYNLSDACTSFGNCSYQKLCDSSEPEKWIPIYFVERNWNPMHKDQLANNEKD